MKLPSPAVPSQGPLVQPHVRLGLSRAEAAEYTGVGVSLFDQMVADGRMPRPKLINSRKVWQRQRLEEAFAELPEEGQTPTPPNPWNDLSVA
jgi:predicted DNA-binding transcriptional regulator AlpA